MPFDHVSWDLETLGTVADSVIASIGAVKFDLVTGEIHDSGFYTVVSLESNLEWKRRIQPDTLRWWMQQSDEARKAAFPAIPRNTKSLGDMLESLTTWLHPTPGRAAQDYKVWANGADFDTPMLAHAFMEAGMPAPWKYWNSRCVRTYKTLPQAAKVKVERIGTHHNALDDAIHQARLVCAIHKELMK